MDATPTRPRRPVIRTIAASVAGAAVAGLALTFGWSAPAAAHGPLVASSPSPGHTVSSVETIELEFGDALDPTTTQSVELITPSGVALTLTGHRFEDTDRTLVVDAPPLTEVGVHTVRYGTVAADGHLQSGEIAFTYLPGTPGPSGVVVLGGSAAAIALAGFAINRRRWANPSTSDDGGETVVDASDG
ncbi:MAG: copper resistance protein CopC [Actinomycetota bacterium]|nr:copper resistance protein CopC [Actinomycetota bacterium]